MADLERKILLWLASRDTGISSETIAFAALGIKRPDGSPPIDPDDLGRCLRLLGFAPELEPGWRDAVVSLNPLWAVYVERWDELAASMEREVGIAWGKGRSAPETYRMMQLVRPDAYERTGLYDVERAPDGTLRSAIRKHPEGGSP